MTHTMKACVGNVIDSPVGKLTLVASERGLRAILWEHPTRRPARLGEIIESDAHPILLQAERQLREYFAGRRTEFSVPLDFRGTEFQRRVWNALLTIPFAETRSYVQIARQIGCPAAVRAVGAANGQNPIPIIAPCHRVIGSDGKLTGFAGGLENKAKLLSHEKMHAMQATRAA
jgi:methylated-DNA-[protein]-cysteine S-methyltransferase